MKCSASLMHAIQALTVVTFGLEKVYVQALFLCRISASTKKEMCSMYLK